MTASLSPGLSAQAAFERIRASLQREYEGLVSFKADPATTERDALVRRIEELERELHAAKKEIERLRQRGRHGSDDEDCEHWRRLLNIELRAIRLLAEDEAAMGRDLPTWKRLELVERRERKQEIEELIENNCP